MSTHKTTPHKSPSQAHTLLKQDHHNKRKNNNSQIQQKKNKQNIRKGRESGMQNPHHQTMLETHRKNLKVNLNIQNDTK
jgi:hypothetical protein